MARLIINLQKIEHNARAVCELLRPHGIKLTGVTKSCLGDPRVGKAMLAGGAAALADSRPENMLRLRRAFPDRKLQLLRPPGDGFSAAASGADLFFVTGARQAALLGAQSPGARVCLMIDCGDGREGVPAEDAAAAARQIAAIASVRFAGVATNLACARKTASLKDCLALFNQSLAQIHAVSRVKAGSGSFALVSAGGSGLLGLLLEGNPAASREAFAAARQAATPQARASWELRCGEAILLGSIPGPDALFLPEAHRDAFQIEGYVLEAGSKGGQTRALLDFGLQDTGAAPVVCTRPGLTPVSITSDYLAVRCDPAATRPRAGDVLTFIPSYYALVAAMTSPFMKKSFL